MSERVVQVLFGGAALAIFGSALSKYLQDSRTTKKHPVRLVLLLSGKRKSGKDYIAEKLLEKINKLVGREVCAIGRLSAPLKKAYADEHGLDFRELLSDGPYKEQYRAKMIKWGEEKRRQDPYYFTRIVSSEARTPILIISDARRPSDLAYFKDDQASWKCLAIRVESTLEDRKARKWVYTPEVDDAQSECGLDGLTWDVTIQNSGEASHPADSTTSVPNYQETPRTVGGVEMQLSALARHAASHAM